MTECHPSYVALHFPLLAPTSQKGWSPDMTYRCLQPSQMIGNQCNCLTLCDYLQYRLHIRPNSVESDHYFQSSFLFQEYIVEMWLVAEHSQL